MPKTQPKKQIETLSAKDVLAQRNIESILKHIGEDVTRDGLKGTPTRVVKSWGELYSGYRQSPKDVLTTFDEYTDQIVLLRGIEFYSFCEHHMLPFFGTAHIAYLPHKRVVGISKLARVLEIYSRRLQIQERIGEQVVDALMKYLKPKGVACILSAQHFCMTCRGVNKQNSVMVTSAMRGVFRKDEGARAELLNLIRLGK